MRDMQEGEFRIHPQDQACSTSKIFLNQYTNYSLNLGAPAFTI
jgi:hypothetical protein